MGVVVGLGRTRLTRARVADLMVDVARHPGPSALRAALARALRDPSLEVAYFLPDAGTWVDGEGRPVVLPEPGQGRAVTHLDCDGVVVAALVHDPALAAKPAVVDAVCAPARLALENQRLAAAVRAQLEEVRASRARIVEAADAERHRIERNLHDGAQQRLVSAALAIEMARRRADGGDQVLGDLLARAITDLDLALAELRELARGLHPAILVEQGLGAALESLAEGTPVPVRVRSAPEERLPASVEVAAYYVAAESLSNVAKYAHASVVAVDVVRLDSHIAVDVRDDGVGGADLHKGSGLRGLADRVDALGGRLVVTSVRGAGTIVHAELPLS